MAATALVRLGHLTGRTDYQAAAEATLRGSVALMKKAPTAVGQMLLALDLYLGPTPQIAILGNRSRPTHRPRSMSVGAISSRQGGRAAGDAGCRPSGRHPQSRCSIRCSPVRPRRGQEPTVFVCRDFACDAPVSGRAAAIASWDKLETQTKAREIGEVLGTRG